MFSQVIRKQRELFGLTQAKLSFIAGVSLPTIQNIEAGRANPELETVQRLLQALGMETQFVARRTNWNFLSLCGVPLYNIDNAQEVTTYENCSKERFIGEMRLAINECNSSLNPGDKDRKFKALGATLLALQTHYPSVYAEFSSSTLAKELLNQTGLQKLRRIALKGLQKFL
ncbi:MAG: helix-turn-helix domain-containing protein [Proteobacteria bacterium]|nr:helix-turn-helix domain-containing protein [Pseudomonadota bacterium]